MHQNNKKKGVLRAYQMCNHVFRRQALPRENGLQTSSHALIGFDFYPQHRTTREFQSAKCTEKKQRIRRYTERKKAQSGSVSRSLTLQYQGNERFDHSLHEKIETDEFPSCDFGEVVWENCFCLKCLIT